MAEGIMGGTLVVKDEAGREHTVQFSLSAEYGWSQWGASEAVLFGTMPVVEAAMDKALELGYVDDMDWDQEDDA